MLHVSRVATAFLREYHLHFHVAHQNCVFLGQGAPKGLLRIEGPLTDILLREGILPEQSLLEPNEVTSTGIDYSPCMMLALQAWNFLAEKELRAAAREGRPWRCAIYTRSHNSAWVDSQPPLPYAMVSWHRGRC